MSTVITILVDNTAGSRGTVAEHGFSAWITCGTDRTLFDTGAGNALFINARSLKKNFRDIQRVVLSHGHWDHTGGLKQVLELRDHTEIIAHPGIFEERFSVRKRGDEVKYHPAGIPFSREELEQAGAHFHLTREYYEIASGMYFSGEITRPQNWQSSDEGLVLRDCDEYLLDPIMDDVSLLFDTDSGPVVLFGCAHAGADTILNYLSEKSGYTSFHAVIGGTHLFRADQQRAENVIAIFEKYQVQTIVATHCTGFSAMAQLYFHFKDRFKTAKVGDVFEF